MVCGVVSPTFERMTRGSCNIHIDNITGKSAEMISGRKLQLTSKTNTHCVLSGSLCNTCHLLFASGKRRLYIANSMPLNIASSASLLALLVLTENPWANSSWPARMPSMVASVYSASGVPADRLKACDRLLLSVTKRYSPNECEPGIPPSSVWTAGGHIATTLTHLLEQEHL